MTISRERALEIADALEKMAAEAPDIEITDLDRAAEAVVAWEAIKVAYGQNLSMPPAPSKGPATAKSSVINKAMPVQAMKAPMSTTGGPSATAKIAEEEKIAFVPEMLMGLGGLAALGAGGGGLYVARAGMRGVTKRIGASIAKEDAQAAMLAARKAHAKLGPEQLKDLGIKGVGEAAEEASKGMHPLTTAAIAGGGVLGASELLRKKDHDGIRVQKVAQAAGFADALLKKQSGLRDWLAKKFAPAALKEGRTEQALKMKPLLERMRSQTQAARGSALQGATAQDIGTEAWRRYRGLPLGAQIGIPAGGLLLASRMGGGRDQTVQKF